METLIDTVGCMIVEGEGHSTRFLVLCVLAAITVSSAGSYIVGALMAAASLKDTPVESDEYNGQDDDGVRLGYKEDW